MVVKTLTTAFLLTTFNFLSAQEVRGFYFIEEKLELSKSDYVAPVKIKGAEGRATIKELYYGLKKKANQAGGNAFKKAYLNKRDNTLQADVYHLNDSSLNKNISLGETNCIYFFGREMDTRKTLTIKLNGDEIAIRGGEYYKYIIPEGEEAIIIQKVMLNLNSELRVRWREGGAATYVSLTGVQLADPQVGDDRLVLNSRNICFIDSGLGQLLKQQLKPMTTETGK